MRPEMLKTAQSLREAGLLNDLVEATAAPYATGMRPTTERLRRSEVLQPTDAR